MRNGTPDHTGIPVKRRRLIALSLLALAIAPGTWLRNPPAIEHARIPVLKMAPLMQSGSAPGRDDSTNASAGLSLEGLWELRSPNRAFGGFSALLPLGGGRMRAFSDKGDSFTFTAPHEAPGHAGAADPILAPVPPDPRLTGDIQDIEAATRDPATGTIWLAYEQFHAIRRITPDALGTPGAALARPPQMRDWPGNSGAEAMVRLCDGRFLLFGERNGQGLLFPGDPIDGAAARVFDVAWPEGFRPTDAALLPDGRVLILLRAMALSWPPFRSMLAIGDPRAIEDSTLWRPQILANLDSLLPRENYEGLAIEPQGDSLVLWLISDDNFSAFQRTLLARLRWREDSWTPPAPLCARQHGSAKRQ